MSVCGHSIWTPSRNVIPKFIMEREAHEALSRMYPLPLLSLFLRHCSCSFTRQLSENCPRNIFSNQMCQFVHNGHEHPSFLPSRPPSHHFPLFPLECACVVRRSLRRSIRRCPPPFSILRSPTALPSLANTSRHHRVCSRSI